MKRIISGAALFIGGAAVAVTLGVGAAAFAAERGGEFVRGSDQRFERPHRAWSRFTPEDRQAFAEARIAALHAGLRLTPDQETLWPPVEAAIRGMAKVRQEQRDARRERAPGQLAVDLPGALRGFAEAQSARGQAIRQLADAAAPLYATLDEAQKRRVLVLARPMTREGSRHGGHRRGHGPRDE